MTRSGLGTRGLGLAVTLGAIAFAVVLAQTPAPQQPPTFRTEANYVRVDAYPTKDEAPVTDLTQSDFEILESGTPQKIEQFERVVIQAPARRIRAWSPTPCASRWPWRRTPAPGSLCCSSTPITSKSTARAGFANRSSTRSIADRHGRSRRRDDAGDVGHRYHLRAQDDDDRRLPDALLALGRPRQDEPRRPGGSGVHRVLPQRASECRLCGSERHRRGDARSAPRKAGARRAGRPGGLSARSARGAQSDSRDQRRMAVVSSERNAGPSAQMRRRADRTEGVDRPTVGQTHDQGSERRLRPEQTVPDRSDAPGAARQRSAVPRSSRCRESRQRIVLSRSIREGSRSSTPR